MTKVLKELSNAKPKWREIRQIIANANVSDFEELFRYLYDNARSNFMYMQVVVKGWLQFISTNIVINPTSVLTKKLTLSHLFKN